MADIDYEVEVTVKLRGRVIDRVEFDDEDYGWAMWRLRDWAIESEATKDL